MSNYENWVQSISNESYENKALLFSERYGVINYKINGNKMIYYCNYCYPYEGNKTYKHIVNLKTMKETVIELKRYYKNKVLAIY